jgi:hypothetical protein
MTKRRKQVEAIAYLRISSATNTGSDKDSDKRQRSVRQGAGVRHRGRVLRCGRERRRSDCRAAGLQGHARSRWRCGLWIVGRGCWVSIPSRARRRRYWWSRWVAMWRQSKLNFSCLPGASLSRRRRMRHPLHQSRGSGRYRHRACSAASGSSAARLARPASLMR